MDAALGLESHESTVQVDDTEAKRSEVLALGDEDSLDLPIE